MNFTHVDSMLFFAVTAVALGSCAALFWVWRQKNESEERLTQERARLKEAQTRWFTEQQGFESRMRKLQEQAGEPRRAQAGPVEQPVAKRSNTRSYRQEFDSAPDGGQKTRVYAASDSIKTAAATSAMAPPMAGRADNRLELESRRLEEQQQELRAGREKLAQDQEAYERRMAEDKKRYEREVQDRYKGEMEKAAEQILQADQARDSAAGEIAKLAEESQRIAEARRSAAEAGKSVLDQQARLDEAQRDHDRKKAALEDKHKALEQLAGDLDARQRQAAQQAGEAERRLSEARAELARREQGLTERDAALKTLGADLQTRQAALASREQQSDRNQALNAARARELDTEARRVQGVAEAAEARYREAQERDRQAQAQRLAAEQLAQKAAQGEEEARGALREAGEHRELARQDLADAKRHREEIECVRQTFWPSDFRTGPLAPWKDRLEKAVAGGDQDARLLLSFVHVYHAADTAAADTKNIRDALKEISRYLFKYLNRTADPQECRRQGSLWAEELNKNGKGRFSIQLPGSGDPIDANWMIRPSNNAQSVSTVITWAVRDAKGIATHRAEVA